MTPAEPAPRPTPGPLLQISDPHFGTEQPRVVEALLRLAHALRPELAVLSGDITQRATPAQFAAARQFVERLGVPRVLAIPGNHDLPLLNLALRLIDPYRRYRAAFGDDLEPRYESTAWRVITVNTTRAHRHKHGEVSRRQIERVAHALAEAGPAQLRVVVVHQPAAVVRAADAEDLLRGHRNALRRWSEAGADIVLGGHIHRPYVLAIHARDPALGGRTWVVQAGTAVSTRVREDAGNSVNLLRPTASDGHRGCIVERWDYRLAEDRFTQAATDHLNFTR